ncbi:MFS transporter [Cupriavidus basilensis]|uniref:MFS transporter n=1 Tax=Cupriavidus basilensis TaxID=68895 RepID=A0ABT6B384_9BURK|nr:MFS transporter [Cupriavidus basilensis]MDF3839199.1 MFS transporter [Cupriavidus basilensis]
MRLTPMILSNALCMAAMMAFVAVIGPIVRVLGLAEWHAGLTVTAAGLVWMLAARAWGRASDRRGRKPVLIAGLIGVGLAYLGLALFVDHALTQPPAVLVSILALVLLRGLLGAFFAAIAPALNALVADHAAPAQRVGQMAMLGAGNAIGMVVGPAAAGALATLGLSAPLYAAALLPWLALALLVPALPPARGHSARETSTLALSDPRIRLPLLAAFLGTYCVVSAQLVLGFFVLDRLDLNPAQGARAAGWALAAVGLALIAAQGLVSWRKHVSAKRWMSVGALLGAAGFAAAATATSMLAVILTCALAGAGMGLLFPAFQAAASNAVDHAEQGIAAGSVSAAQGLAMVCAPLVATLIYRIGPALPFVCSALLLVGLSLASARHRAPAAASGPAAQDPG